MQALRSPTMAGFSYFSIFPATTTKTAVKRTLSTERANFDLSDTSTSVKLLPLSV